MKELIELKIFTKNRREVSIDSINGLVNWKNKTYRLEFKTLNNETIPFVLF